MCSGTCVHIHLACYAGEAPEVLVLAVGAVAPAHHLHGNDCLLSGHHILGDVELCFELRVLAVAHLLAVHPQGEVTGGRAHVHIDALSLPAGWDGECTAVGTRVVVLLLHHGRVVGKLGCPGVAHVLVGLVAVSIHLEESGHGEVLPSRVVIAGHEEVLRGQVVVFDKLELPHSFHRQKALASLLEPLLCQGL